MVPFGMPCVVVKGDKEGPLEGAFHLLPLYKLYIYAPTGAPKHEVLKH